jgi:PAS domain S-box-containing protein
MSDRRVGPAQLAQQYLAAIVQNADDAIISKDLNSTIISWNPAAERMFGYAAQEMIGQSITRLIPLELANEEATILARIRAGGQIDHFETKRLRKNGDTLDVSLTISPVRDDEGVIVGASHIARDISEKKGWEQQQTRLLEDARKARRQAENANQAKDEFLATVSHELRTPLTSMVGWIRMLRTGGLPGAKIERAMEVLDRNVRAQAQLIEDLLDISRITSGNFRLDVRPIEPALLISAAVESLRVAAEAKSIRIHTVLDSQAGPVAGDPERFQQVMWNLISNAIKFTPKGGRVQIVLERVNSHIEVRVTDTGKGIRAEFLPYVFERFTQGAPMTTRTESGLGMGLAISKVITELHGGSISAFSAGETAGATFTVKIPVMPLTKERLTSTRVHPKAWTDVPIDCPPQISGLRVLVVDDDPDTCEMIRAVLEQCGGIVQTALNAESAMALFRTWQPGVLLSDIGLPGVDGYELVRRIREEERTRGIRTPAVALTAFARVEDRVKALAAGYQMHVPKPVEPGELLTIVASVAAFMDPHSS